MKKAFRKIDKEDRKYQRQLRRNERIALKIPFHHGKSKITIDKEIFQLVYTLYLVDG